MPSTPKPATAPDGASVGIALTVISVMVFGIQDAVAKILVQDYSPFQIAMIRYWGFGLFALWLVARQAPLRHAFRSAAPWTQFARGLLLMFDIWLFATAIRTVPLAELNAIILIFPLLVVLFSIPLLGERVGPFRLGAVAAGFAGTLFILRPGGLPFDQGVAFAIAAAVCYALYITLTRKVARVDSTATSMVYVGTVGLVLSTAVGVFHWQALDPMALALVAVVVVTTCAGHGLMMRALSLAPASTLQPFNFLSMPWAIVLSFVVFGHLIDFVSFIGAAIICAAGLVIWWRERTRKVAVTPAEATTPGQAAPPPSTLAQPDQERHGPDKK